MTVQWFSRSQFAAAARSRILPADVVLDVGAGIHPQTLIHSRVHICVEPHATYVRRLLETADSDPRLVVLAAGWSEAMSVLPDKSVDTVMAIDFIEHLLREDGECFLAEAERVARSQIVVFTPLGFYPQGVAETGADRWGLDGGEWQAHRSGWSQGDFGADWDLLCCRDYHLVDEHDRPLDEPFGAFWAISTFVRPRPPLRVRAASASHAVVDRFWTWAGGCVSAARHWQGTHRGSVRQFATLRGRGERAPATTVERLADVPGIMSSAPSSPSVSARWTMPRGQQS